MDAKKQRFAADDLKQVFQGADRIIAARGKSFVVFEPKKKEFDFAAMAEKVLGPSGNLRAPAARVGKTWLVGFAEEAWQDVLG